MRPRRLRPMLPAAHIKAKVVWAWVSFLVLLLTLFLPYICEALRSLPLLIIYPATLAKSREKQRASLFSCSPHTSAIGCPSGYPLIRLGFLPEDEADRGSPRIRRKPRCLVGAIPTCNHFGRIWDGLTDFMATRRPGLAA